MKKITIVILSVIAISIVALSSCKKKSGTPSVASMITGNWKITTLAIDTNGNGKMDPNEISTDTSYAHTFITFSSNGLGTTVYYGSTDAFSWALSNNNTFVTIIDTSSSGNTGFFHIDQLSSTSMTLKDTTGGIAVWEIFAKQ